MEFFKFRIAQLSKYEEFDQNIALPDKPKNTVIEGCVIRIEFYRDGVLHYYIFLICD